MKLPVLGPLTNSSSCGPPHALMPVALCLVSCLLIGYGNRGRWEETKPYPLELETNPPIKTLLVHWQGKGGNGVLLLQPLVMNQDPRCHSSCGTGVGKDGHGVLLTGAEAESGQVGLCGFGGVEEGRLHSSAPGDVTPAWKSTGCGLLRKVVRSMSRGLLSHYNSQGLSLQRDRKSVV